MVLCLSVFHCSVYGVVFVCVSLLSVWCCVCVSLLSVWCCVCLCFTAQCMVLCLSVFHCSVYGVCFMFLYDSLALDAETRASLVKERSSF